MIRRLVQLVMDRDAAKKVEKEVGGALDRGTRSRKPVENIGRIEKSLDQLKGAAVKLGAVLAGIWAVRRVFEYGKAIFQLGADVRAVGSQFNTVFGESSASMQAWLDDFRRVAGLTNREAQQLSAGSGSMAQGFGMGAAEAAEFSKQVLTLSGDLASFNNIPTAQAAQLVNSALIGNTEAARSLKVSFTALDVQTRALANTGKGTAKELTQAEKALASLQVMTERAGPQIGDLARTQNDADNQAKQLAASWNQLRESMAAAMVGGTAGSTVFRDIADVFDNLTKKVEENSEAIAAWVRALVPLGRAAFETFRFMARVVSNSFEAVGASIAMLFNNLSQTWARTINVLLNAADKIPGVNIEFRLNELTPEEFATQQRLLSEGIEQNAKNMGDALYGLGAAYRDVGRAAAEAARTQGAAVGAGAGAGGAPGAGGGGSGFNIGTPAGRSVGGTDFVGGIQGPPHALVDPVAARRAREQIEAEMVLLQDRAQSVADGMTHAFDGFFNAMLGGFDGVNGAWGAFADLAQGVGQTVIAGLADGMADYHMAQGAGKLAEGTWPPNPAAWAAATQHFLAAGLFRALPALAGAGGGGRGASVPSGAVRSSMPGIQNPMGAEVHIYLDPLNPNDPRFQRVVLGAEQQARDRFGDNVKIHHHSRTA